MSVKKSVQAAFDSNIAEMQKELKMELNLRALDALNERKIHIAKNALKED